MADCGGIAGLIGCLESPVGSTVRYGIVGLYYLWEFGGKQGVLERGGVVELVEKFSKVDGFCHLAQALLDKILEA